MPKVLDPGTVTEITRQTGAKPVIIIRVDWGIANIKFYADRDLIFTEGDSDDDASWGLPWPLIWGAIPDPERIVEGRLLDIGTITTQWQDGNMGTTGSATIVLDDDDEALRQLLNTHVLEGSNVTIYQWFQDPLNELGPTKIMQGTAGSPVKWDEAAHTLTFDVTPILKSGQIGFLATEDDLTNIINDAIGQIWPRCYGTPVDVPALLVTRGPFGELRSDVKETATTFKVKNGKKFPQGEEISIQVGQEIILGEFSGSEQSPSEQFTVKSGNVITYKQNVNFHIDAKTIQHDGRNQDAFTDVAVSPRTGDDSNNPAVFVIDNPDGNIDVTGLIAYVKIDGQVRHWAPVKFQLTQPDSTLVTIICTRSLGILLGDPGVSNADLVSFAAFPRRGWDKPEERPRVLKAGTPVIQKDSREGVYVVNEVETTRILRVAARRKIKINSSEGEKEVLTTIPDDWYVADKTDTTLINGKTVTTLEFEILPEFRGNGFTNEVFVTLQSTLSGNPADVMLDVLAKAESINVNGASFNALSDNLADTIMDFAILNSTDALTLANELAFQARCTLVYLVDVVKLRYLPSGTLGTVAGVVLNDENIEENSIILEHTPVEDLVTQFVGIYKPSYFQEEDSKIIVQNNISQHGLINEDIDYFAFQQQESVRVSIAFWIGFKSTIWRLVRVSTFLDALSLEALDSVFFVNDLLLIPTGVFTRPHEVNLEPLADRMQLLLWTPLAAGTINSSPDAFIEISPDEDNIEIPLEQTEELPPTSVDFHITQGQDGVQNSEGVAGVSIPAQITKGKFPNDEANSDGKFEARAEETPTQTNLPSLTPTQTQPEKSETYGDRKLPITAVGPMLPTKNEITLLIRTHTGFIYHSPISKWL